MDHVEVFSNATFKSHMPFFDGTDLAFCRSDRIAELEFQSEGLIWSRIRHDPRLAERFKDLPRSRRISCRPWKLFRCSWTERRPERIETGLDANAIECSPAFYRDADDLHVSFIGGVPTSRRLYYRLYAMSGPSWDKLSPAKSFANIETLAGFVSPLHVCFAFGNRLDLTERGGDKQSSLECPLQRVLRVTYRADDPQSLLVTGISADQQEHTLLHNLGSNETFEVRAPGNVYKSSIYGDQIIFAERSREGFEERRLKHGKYTVEPCGSQIISSVRDIAAIAC